MSGFQFPLWDTVKGLFDAAVNSVNFQFPLWDTGIMILFGFVQKLFQFPLWDTLNAEYIFFQCTMLSIPFMGYQMRLMELITRMGDFQFPLWDTFWGHFLSPISHIIFQFPLWDTTNYTQKCFTVEYTFQFPLWDTMTVKTVWRGEKTFNSLYGIHVSVFAFAVSVSTTFQFPLWDT